MIEANHLTKRYRKKVAVSDLSFKVEKGKVTGFLGPNGSGKSTTMRLMLGLDHGEGKTTFDGKMLHEYAQPSHAIGVLLEAKAFHPNRTAHNHLEVLAAAAGISDKRVDEVLDLVGLKEVAKKRPGKFSLGMSQRLGIAAAILGEPEYLMLDEPANGLDPEGIAWLRQFIKDYAKAGNAVFISSHLLSEMSQMADNVVVIGKGKMIASASVADIIGGSTNSSVFVRTSDSKKLEKAMKAHKIDFTSEDKGFSVTGTKTDDIGKLAFAEGLTVLELANRTVSLEEAFLELTAGTAEYTGHASGSAEPETKKRRLFR